MSIVCSSASWGYRTDNSAHTPAARPSRPGSSLPGTDTGRGRDDPMGRAVPVSEPRAARCSLFAAPSRCGAWCRNTARKAGRTFLPGCRAAGIPVRTPCSRSTHHLSISGESLSISLVGVCCAPGGASVLNALRADSAFATGTEFKPPATVPPRASESTIPTTPVGMLGTGSLVYRHCN
jgi:hypothetical protein